MTPHGDNVLVAERQGKALDLTVRFRDERMNRVKAAVVIVDEGKETDAFWSDIGGQKPIAPADRFCCSCLCCRCLADCYQCG